MTGAWLLADDENQISDCTGGRIGDAVRYCQSEQNKREWIIQCKQYNNNIWQIGMIAL